VVGTYGNIIDEEAMLRFVPNEKEEGPESPDPAPRFRFDSCGQNVIFAAS
jgi:hypothetical protein